MQKIQLIILFLACALTLSAASASTADKLFNTGDYTAALQEYDKLLKSSPSNTLYLYRYARCAQELGDYRSAIQYFEKAGNKYVSKYFYLGESYLHLWQVDAAIEAYETFLEEQQTPNNLTKIAQQQLWQSQKMQRYMRRVERIQILDSVQVPIDSILHACTLSNEAGQLTYDSLHNIIYTNQLQDRKLWSMPVDSNLMLVSSYRLLDTWAIADTLPQTINFTHQQCSPYLLNDGVTLYFAANDTNGLGGLDIYVSRFNTATNTYTKPENVGMPYNSPANEYLLLLDEIRQIGYLATDRFATPGYAHVYSFIIPQQKQYWRTTDTDSLAAYAQLALFELGSTDSIIQYQSIIEQPTEETDNFQFVINDSIIYQTIEDFSQPIAQEKFLEWQKTEQQYQSEKQLLSQLRIEYSTADQQRQKELTPTILQLENNQSQLSKRCQSLLLEIRAIELKAR